MPRPVFRAASHIHITGTGSMADYTLPMPDGFQAGDLLLAFGWGNGTNVIETFKRAAGLYYPADGWTHIASSSNGPGTTTLLDTDAAGLLIGKIADGTEGSLTYSMGGNARGGASVAAYSGVGTLPELVSGNMGSGDALKYLTPLNDGSPNVIPNPGFEFDTSTVVSPPFGPAEAPVTVSRSTDAQAGGYSLQVDWTQTVGHQGVGIDLSSLGPFKAGKAYTIEFWLKCPTVVNRNALVQARLGDAVATEDYRDYFTYCNPSSTWTRYRLTWEPTADRADPALFLYDYYATTMGYAYRFLVDSIRLLNTSLAGIAVAAGGNNDPTGYTHSPGMEVDTAVYPFGGGFPAMGCLFWQSTPEGKAINGGYTDSFEDLLLGGEWWGVVIGWKLAAAGLTMWM